MSELWSTFLNSIEPPLELLGMILTAAIIVFIGLIAGRIISKLIRKTLHRFGANKLLKEAHIDFDAEEFSEKASKWIIYAIAFFMALTELGIGTIVISIVMLTLVAIMLILMILGLRDTIPNIFAGIYLHSKHSIKVGDRIKVDKIRGKVEYINLIHVRIKDEKGNIIVMPSSSLTNKEIVIYRRL